MRRTTQAVSSFLEKALSQGYRWVSFPGQNLPVTPERMEGHRSAIVASRRSESFSFSGVNIIYGKRNVPARYAAVTNLLREIDYERRGLLPLATDLATLQRLMAEAQLNFSTGSNSEDQCARLALGDIVLVERAVEIVPYREIGTFYVLTGQPMSEQAFGEGAFKARIVHHGSNLTGAFDALLDARKWLSEHPQAPSMLVRLIGGLRQAGFEFNQYGEPLRGTGIELSRTSWQGGTIHSTQVLDVYKPLTVQQQLFAQFDKDRQSLVISGDELQDISRVRKFSSYGSPLFEHTLLPELVTAAKKVLFAQAAQQKRDRGEGQESTGLTP